MAEIASEDNENVSKMLRFTTVFTKAHFNEIPDIIIIIIIIIIFFFFLYLFFS